MLTTVSLIGMPGAGKSTVGVLLAKALGLNFVDSDLLLQVQYQASLQEILESEGYLSLREKEQDVLLNIALANSLVSTGGSAVYSNAAMERLRRAGPVVFIDIPLATVLRRIDNADCRGIACAPGQDLAAVYAERRPLYLQFATHVVDGDTAAADITAKSILELLGCDRRL